MQDQVNNGVAERLLAFACEMRDHADTDKDASLTHRLIVQWAHGLETLAAMRSVPDEMVLVNRKDAELAGRFAFNNAGKGLRSGVSSAGERLLLAARGAQ